MQAHMTITRHIHKTAYLHPYPHEIYHSAPEQILTTALQWRHNEHDSVSNHQTSRVFT